MTATETRGAADPGVAHRLDCLDGYRALAALAVVVFHLTSRPDTPARGIIVLDAGAWVSRAGNVAVCVFFLVSGLVLYRPFVAAHLRGTATPRVGSYLRRRLLRIFPAYLVALTAFYLLGLLPEVRPHMTIWEYVWQYALLQNYVRRGFATSLPVAWTLCTEMSFYLALPLLAWAICHLPGARSADRSERLRAHLAGVAMLYAAGWGYRVLLLQMHPLWPGSPPNWLPAFLDWFALGMLLAVLHAWRAEGGRLPRVMTEIANMPWLCWIVALELYWVSLQLRVPGNFMDDGPRSLARFALNGTAAFLLLVPAVLSTRRTLGLRALDVAPLRFLGTISYGIYLWHLIVSRWMDRLDLQLAFVPHFALVLAITIVLAAASHRLVELPAMSWRRARTVRSHLLPQPALITQ